MSTATDTSTNITDVVLEQHREATRQLAAALDAGDNDRAAHAFASPEALFSGHEAAEDGVIYPTLRKLGNDGAHIDRARTKVGEAATKTLTNLHAMAAGSAEFIAALREFSAAVHNHAASEEAEVPPLLKPSLSDTQRQSMGDAFLAAQKN